MAQFGFLYDKISGARDTSRRHFLALTDPDQEVAVGTFNLNTTTGLQAITGVGFLPSLVGIIGVVLPSSIPNQYGAAFHLGFAAGSDQWAGSCTGEYNNFTWNADRHSYWRDDRVIAYVGGSYRYYPQESFRASLNSFDADGFTLNIDQAPSSTIRCIYLAARNGGGYKVGTTQAPTVTGNQAITGVGFRPKAVLIANGPGGLLLQDHQWIGVGAGDASEQYSIWSGARKGAPFLSARNDTGKIVTFAHSSTSSFGVGRGIDAQASLLSMENDGFLLNWSSADSQTRYFHWLAIGEADIGRFLFDPTANDKEVATEAQPVGLLGYGNDQIEEGWDPNNSGAGIGVSFCNSDGSIEYTAAFHEGYPQTLSITKNRRDLHVGGSFGAFKYPGAGTSNGMRNLCDVVSLFGISPIVSMNWRYAQRHGVASRALLGEQ